MRPTARQQAALVLAEADGYVRPASPTHARRCGTSVGHLANTAKQCERAGWLRLGSGGRYVITDAGRVFVPGAPLPDDRDLADF